MSRGTRDTAGGRKRPPTGLSPSMAGLSRPLLLGLVLPCRGPTTPAEQARPVWAGPRSLAATRGIAVAFSSPGYLDVSVPRVGSLSGDAGYPTPGFPIRTSWDDSLCAASPGLSQLTTSFIASRYQGIHRAPYVLDLKYGFSLGEPKSLSHTSAKQLRRAVPEPGTSTTHPRIHQLSKSHYRSEK